MEKKYKIKNPSEFKIIIEDILSWFKKNHKVNLILALQGDLGTGKTTFTQELAKYFGVKETVNSPTFVIMKKYDLIDDMFDTLVHIDAYRLEDESETKPLNFKEIFSQSKIVCCVEWPEIIANILPTAVVWLKLEIEDDFIRKVTVRIN